MLQRLLAFAKVALLLCVFCAPRALSAFYGGNEIFLVQELSLQNNSTLEVSTSVGSFASGQIAMVDDQVLVGGSNGVYLVDTKNQSAGVSLVSDNPDLFFLSDLSNGMVVSFLGANMDALSGPGFLTAITIFDPRLGIDRNTTIRLSQPIFVGLSSAVFAGFGRFVVTNGATGKFFQVNTTTGSVSSLPGSVVNRWKNTEGWVAVGVAEFFTFEDTYLLYANNDGQVEQQNMNSGNAIEVVYSEASFSSLAAVAVSPRTNKWAFHCKDVNPLGGFKGASTVGIADATFIDAWPTSQPSAQPTSRPTAQPSSQPSTQPTAQPNVFPTSTPSSQPTSQPTLHYDAPKILSLTVSPSSTSIFRLSVGLDMNSWFAGTVYCSAFASGTSVTSLTQIRTTGVAQAYQPYSTTVSLQISGLTPSSTYDVFCYVSTSQGYSNTLADALATKNTQSTGCCKQVTFTNSPVAVYSDATKYVGAQTTEYIFTFSLNAAPKSTLVVTPTLRNATTRALISSSLLSVSPAKFTFRPSSQLTGSFSLSAATSSLSTHVNISLVLGNSSASEYFTTSTVVQMLSTFEPPPAPLLSSVRFSNNGGSLYGYFDSSTNLGSKSYASWVCSDLFSFPASSKSNCIWLNTTTVQVSFRSGTSETELPVVGSSFMLLPNKIKALCRSSFSSECDAYVFSAQQNKTISAPPSPTIPTVILTAPVSVGGCDNLTIVPSLSTGNAGRNWTSLQWTVTNIGSGGNAGTLQSYLANFGTSRSITVRRSLLEVGRYSISLTVQNFLGQSKSATIIVDVSASTDVPSLSILGASSYTITADDSLDVAVIGSFSSCSNGDNYGLSYRWSVSSEDQLVPSIVSTNRDGTIFSVPGSTFSPGEIYTISVNCSVTLNGAYISSSVASVSVTVANGAIVAVVSGGNVRQLAADYNATLDVSPSYDQNTGTSAGLFYEWTCTVGSALAYGQECNELIKTNNQQTILIQGSALNQSLEFLFVARVYSADNRSDSVTISVQPAPVGSPYTELLIRSSQKFNVNQNLSISGLVKNSLDTTTSWTILLAGQNISVSSFTPLEKVYPSQMAIEQLLVSLLLAADTFTAGAYVTFRLTAISAINDQRRLTDMHTAATTTTVSKSEIVIVANVPPQGGQLVVDPSSGDALFTTFQMESIDWTDDPEDFPLQYEFFYSMTSTQPMLSLQLKGQSNTVSTYLSAGMESYNNSVILTTRVYDRLSAFSSATQTVACKPNFDIDLTNFLATNIQIALSTGSVSKALATTNTVASTMNYVQCGTSNPALCAQLNRRACETTPNTCGPCLAGYQGISGDSNAKCLSVNGTSDGSVGSNCTANEDCMYGLCSDGTCAAPPKPCTTVVEGSVCSGGGECRYFDYSGNSLESSDCPITNVNCRATCECFDGFGGASCEFTQEKLLERDSTRGLLCLSLNDVNNMTDASSGLLESISGSLLSSYIPEEVVTSESTSTCSSTLSVISSLAAQGYLVGATMETSSYLVSSASSFVTSPTSNNDTTRSSLVSESVSNITQGLFSALTNGQEPVNIVSDNIFISVRKDLELDLQNASLSPPLSEDELAYGTLPLSVQFDGSAASACAGSDNYVQLSVMKWGTNPFANSSDVLSPLLRMTSVQSSSSSARKAVANRRRLQSTDSTPAYFITLQFNGEQNFNFSISPEEAALLPGNNFTFPECTFQDGDTYRSCTGCNISTYTNFNVTYACYDVSQLCSGASDESDSSSLALMSAWRDYQESMAVGGSTWKVSGERRYLQTDDDGSSGGGGMSLSQYGALFMAVKGVLLSTLSSNPFAVDIEEAKVIISLVGSIGMVMICGSIFFSRWDHFDRDQLIYAHRWPPKLFNRKIIPASAGKKQRAKESLVDEEGKDEPQRSMLGLVWKEDNDPVVKAKGTVATIETADKAHSSSSSSSLKRKDKETEMRHFRVSGATSFYDLAIPDIFRHNFVRAFFSILISRHDFTTVFFTPSITTTRLLRWIDLWKAILIGLFIDTIFFSVFYSNDGSCQLFTTRQLCVMGMNSITSEPTCQWTVNADCTGDASCDASTNGTCDLRPPPEDMTFSIMLALICMIVGVPVDMLFSFVLETYASKRPVLEQIGLTSEYWLGRSTAANHTPQSSVAGDSEGDSKGARSELYAEMETAEEKWSAKTREVILASDNDALPAYSRYLTHAEECERILRIVKLHYAEHQFVSLNTTQLEEDIKQEVFSGRALALRRYLGILPDGSLMRLKPWEYLWHSDASAKLMQRLEGIKAQERVVQDAVDSASEYGPQVQEVTLLQYFILDQFGAFNKWILQNQLFCFENFSPEAINAVPWIASWVFVIGSLAFYVYWVLAWGVSSGNMLLKAWGLNFAIGAIQDIFFVQIAKLFVIYAVALFTIKPQLASMKLLLQNWTLSYLSGSIPARKVCMSLLHSNNANAQILQQESASRSSRTPRSPAAGSAAARTAPSTAVTVTTDQDRDILLSSATFRVIQTTSAACRTAWNRNCAHLGVAKILRQLDDVDAQHLHSVRSNSVGWLTLLIAAFPFIAYTYFGDAMGDVLVDMFLPTLSSGFILANSFLIEYSVLALIIVYAGGGGLFLWKKGFFNFVARQVQRTTKQFSSRRQSSDGLVVTATAKTVDSPVLADKASSAGMRPRQHISTVSIVKLQDSTAHIRRRGDLGQEIRSYIALRLKRAYRNWRWLYDRLTLKPDLATIERAQQESFVWSSLNMPLALQAQARAMSSTYRSAAGSSISELGRQLQDYFEGDAASVASSPSRPVGLASKKSREQLLEEGGPSDNDQEVRARELPSAIRELRVKKKRASPSVRPALPVNDHEGTKNNICEVDDTSFLSKLLARHLLHCPADVSSRLRALPASNATLSQAYGQTASTVDMNLPATNLAYEDSDDESDYLSGRRPEHRLRQQGAQNYASNTLSAAALKRLILVSMVKLYLEKLTTSSQRDNLKSTMREMTRALSQSRLDMAAPTASPATPSLASRLFGSSVHSPATRTTGVAAMTAASPAADRSTAAEDLQFTAEHLVDTGMEQPLLIGDLQYMMREVWRVVPMHQYLRVAGYSAYGTQGDYLSAEEVHELMQDFNVWIHSQRLKRNESKLPFDTLRVYISALVDRLFTVSRRAIERTKQNVRRVIEENKKKMMAEAGSDDEDSDGNAAATSASSPAGSGAAGGTVVQMPSNVAKRSIMVRSNTQSTSIAPLSARTLALSRDVSRVFKKASPTTVSPRQALDSEVDEEESEGLGRPSASFPGRMDSLRPSTSSAPGGSLPPHLRPTTLAVSYDAQSRPVDSDDESDVESDIVAPVRPRRLPSMRQQLEDSDDEDAAEDAQLEFGLNLYL